MTGSDTPELLRAEGICKSFGPVAALQDASIVVRRGEVVALAGENGSGKSTLARIIGGVIQADQGIIELDGRSVRFRSPHEAVAAGVCLTAQETALVPYLTVAENILLGRLRRPARLVRRSALFSEAAGYLERAGLRLDPRRLAGSLPPGDRELVELARALANDPKLLILDEITTRLPDPERLFTVVERLRADGVGIVLITHRLREIRRMASRASILRDGRSVTELSGGELTDERISAAMVGRSLGEYFRKVPVPIGQVRLELRDLVTDRSRHQISLSVRAGEIVGLAGLVGAGRSELLETIAGGRRVHGGRVLVDDAPLTARSPGQAIRAGVVLVPEDRNSQGLSVQHSIRDNMAAPWLRALRPTRRAADAARAAAAVREYRVRCAGVKAPISSLSGGNAQKVMLARALELRPRVLLLDEPTRGVDIGARSDIYGFLGRMAQEGSALLVASSDLLELLGLADRIFVLAEGRVAGELSRAEASEEAIALLALGGGVHHDAA